MDIKIDCLAIIPARGGSKRIPRKNVKDFFGKPIISYSIEAALSAGIFGEVMVSTEDKGISELSQKYGASVPFLRSAATSSDTAGTASVLIEVLDEYAKLNRYFKYICCIYPCAPFVTPERLSESINQLIITDADSVIPIAKFSYPPQRCLVIRNNSVSMLYPENHKARSQDYEPLYHDAGQFYCIKSESLKKEGTLFCKHTIPIIMPESEIHDIDSEEDWKVAEIKYRLMNNI